jgi:hypothetical protein
MNSLLVKRIEQVVQTVNSAWKKPARSLVLNNSVLNAPPKLLALLVLIAALSNCGEVVNLKYWRQMDWGSYVKPVEGPAYHPVTETDPLNAIVYVYRPFSDWADQELQSPNIFVQGQGA